jgi:hypothetical protein
VSRYAGQVARQAATVIEQRGWHQGGWLGPNGAVCIRGAFNVAAYGISAMGKSPAELEFTRWMATLVVVPTNGIEPCLDLWNDDKSRTKEEVLAYLNKFAEEHDPQPVLP